MKKILDNKLISMIIILISILIVFIMKFILIDSYGFVEFFLMLGLLVLLLISIFKIFTNKLLRAILVILVIWFAIVSIDYKRHRNLYEPLFVFKNDNMEYVGLGYKVIQGYDMNIQTGRVYKNSSKFYILGIKINEEFVIED